MQTTAASETGCGTNGLNCKQVTPENYPGAIPYGSSTHHSDFTTSEECDPSDTLNSRNALCNRKLGLNRNDYYDQGSIGCGAANDENNACKITGVVSDKTSSSYPCGYCGDNKVNGSEECDGETNKSILCQGVTKEYYYSKSSLSSNPSDMTCSNCQKTGHCYSYCGDGTKDGSLDEYTNILVALDLDEGSGSTTENTGTLLGSYSISGGGSWATSGKYGKAYNFNGSNTIISTNATKYADSFTMMAWVKVTSGSTITLPSSQSSSGTNGTSGQHYVFGANHESSNAGAGLSVGTNGIFVTAHGDSYMPPLAVYNGSLGTSWHHVAVVFENKIPTIYLDGTLVQTGSQSSRTTYSPTQVGGGDYGHFNGTLDDVRIIGKSLNETQIKAFMDRSGAESCDSGSNNSDDWAASESIKHCNAHCTGYAPYCGDGVLESGKETCDGGTNNSDAWAQEQHCKTNCSGWAPYCGDGVVTSGSETCDKAAAEIACSTYYNDSDYSGTVKCNSTCTGYDTSDCDDGW